VSIGQNAFWVAEDVAALGALETRLAVQETARSAGHGEQLRTVLELAALYDGRGLGIATVSHAALSLGCSEHRAAALLSEAQALVELPGALEAVECGLLSVEQSAVVVRQLSVLPLAARVAVWRRLQQRLVAEAGDGSVLPPSRLNELLRRWVLQADPAEAVERRRRAEAGRTVDYRLRQDGLGDLFCTGFRPPDLHAILTRIASRSAPWGADDDRTADQRRFDAVRDLLLGRDTVPPDTEQGHCVAGCRCRSGQPAPCGAELVVHVPLGAALGSTDEVAVLAGHGPLEADLLTELLLAAPRLRPVWVDPDGIPVAVGDRIVRPQRGDPQSVRQALLDLMALPPPEPAPRHPVDHRPTRISAAGPPEGDRSGPDRDAADHPDRRLDHTSPPPADDGGERAGGVHPSGSPGPYRPPRRLRRLIDIRSPRCEWPGCGARAVRCDSEHDHAWPDGPTCACNLGPCCRRHHQVKQRGWTKTRTAHGVRWTGITGRSWLSPSQHPPPATAVRQLPPVPSTGPFDELSPGELERELWALDLLPPDPGSRALPVDREPEDSDRLAERLLHSDTRWTLDLDDPYRWLDLDPVAGRL
jgi:hypothetical protein